MTFDRDAEVRRVLRGIPAHLTVIRGSTKRRLNALLDKMEPKQKPPRQCSHVTGWCRKCDD